jgi:hypothetical protein
MSVASSCGVAPSAAEIITPESACTALRVEATRDAVCSCVRRSVEESESFMSAMSEERKEQ